MEKLKARIGFTPDSQSNYWLKVIAEYLLHYEKDPSILNKYDLFGNSLNNSLSDLEEQKLTTQFGKNKKEVTGFALSSYESIWLLKLGSLERQKVLEDFEKKRGNRQYRQAITKVGAEDDWIYEYDISLLEPAAFDQPVMFILKLWQEEGIKSPLLSLTLAETMLRVGQPVLTWSAYERTITFSQEKLPESVQKKVISHCMERQAVIEQNSGLPANVIREKFKKNLTAGLKTTAPTVADFIFLEEIKNDLQSEIFYFGSLILFGSGLFAWMALINKTVQS